MTPVPPEAYGQRPKIIVQVDNMPRCWRCNRLLARYCSRPWRIECGRCKAVNEVQAEGNVVPSPLPKTVDSV